MPRVKSRNTAEHIAHVAGELFYSRGIHSVGVEDVAAKADVTKRTVYKHFATKDILVAAGLRSAGKRFGDTQGKAPEDQIFAVFDSLIAWVAEPGFRGCPCVLAIVELADKQHPAHKVALEAKVRRYTWFRDRLAEMHVRDPDEIAEQLVIAFEGAIASAVIRGPRAGRSARALVSQLLEPALARRTVADAVRYALHAVDVKRT